jgi:uncharacterized protein (DUF736 family)
MSDFDNTNRGVLFPNDRKQSDKHPDFKGKGNFGGVDFEVAAWRKKGRNGTTFISLSFKEPYVKPEREERAPDPMDDTNW